METHLSYKEEQGVRFPHCPQENLRLSAMLVTAVTDQEVTARRARAKGGDIGFDEEKEGTWMTRGENVAHVNQRSTI